MPSTLASIRMRYRPASRSSGAIVKPQLPGERSRDAVERRRAEVGIPERLGVEVGVDVDESGRDDAAVGVDRPAGRFVGRADGDDHAVADADVGASARRARSVDDVAAA